MLTSRGRFFKKPRKTNEKSMIFRSQDGPRRPQDDPKTLPSRPKMPPKDAKMLPRRLQDAPRRPRTTQHSPKTLPGRPKTAPRRPKTAPRAFKILSRCFQEIPRGLQIVQDRFFTTLRRAQRAKRAERAIQEAAKYLNDGTFTPKGCHSELLKRTALPVPCQIRFMLGAPGSAFSTIFAFRRVPR